VSGKEALNAKTDNAYGTYEGSPIEKGQRLEITVKKVYKKTRTEASEWPSF
jgi:hypothetical protein